MNIVQVMQIVTEVEQLISEVKPEIQALEAAVSTNTKVGALLHKLELQLIPELKALHVNLPPAPEAK